MVRWLSKHQKICGFVIGGAGGLLLFWVMYGFAVLDPGNIGWCLAKPDDTAQHFIGGWAFLRDAWRWRQFYCRCLLEYERNVRGNQNTQTYVDAILELRRLYHSDLFPEGCVDPQHPWVTPVLPQGEIGVFKRPEEEIRER